MKKGSKDKKNKKVPKSPEITDIIKSMTEDLKKKEAPSSWSILKKYDENKFDYSIITLGQQISMGNIESMTNVYVRLLYSLAACFRLSNNLESQLDLENFEKSILSKVNTTKKILYEFIKENDVFNNIFKHFQNLTTRLSRSSNSVTEMRKKLCEHVRDYITVKFINSDTELVKNAQRFLQPNEKILIFSPNTIIMHFLIHMRAKGVDFQVFLIDDGNFERNYKIAKVLHQNEIKVSLI